MNEKTTLTDVLGRKLKTVDGLLMDIGEWADLEVPRVFENVCRARTILREICEIKD